MTLSKFFGLNQVPYHLCSLFFFGISLWLLAMLGKRLKMSRQTTLIAILIYGASVSNFTRLYFLSAFQEVALVVFLLACLITYLDQKLLLSVIFFVLALFSKETAVVLPFILLVISRDQKRFEIKALLPYFLILLVYSYFRLFHFGLAAGDTYIWNFSPGKLANTTMWYTLWSLGAPELLVDYIGSRLRPIPRFFSDFPKWWPVILGLTILVAGSLLSIILGNLKAFKKNLTYPILFFISLLPFVFLPSHKFPLELGVALIWFSFFIANILSVSKKAIIFLFLYLVLNLTMNYLTYTRHYSVNRAKISQKIYTYFSENYPVAPQSGFFEFINDSTAYTKEWGSSRQILNSVGGSELFRVLYADPGYQVYFQDQVESRPNNIRIGISSYMFLKP